MLDGVDLSWRVERACHLAWPSLSEEICGDWVFRFSGGLSRRGNSANPLRATGSDITPMLKAADAAYAQAGLPTIIRTPELPPPEIAAQLATHSYRPEGETLTLYCDLPPGRMRRDPDVTIASLPDEAWFARMWAMKGLSDKERATYRAIVGELTLPAAFMSLTIDGAVVAMGFVALHDRLLVVESLITDAAHRGRGHAKRLVGAILAWGIEQGVEGACLQVVADNDIAIRLYRGMGFVRELYRYRYWRGPR
ncbi:GNAT family N-acetyltransferase [Dongia sp.]|uniref:GNAT family N-acetyltransferase n=1 Tax=Dongia sp. TaxID=1977262 RepID=UPI0035B3F1BC